MKSAAEPTILDREIARQLISVASSDLSDAQRTAITLAYFEGFTLEEIARRTQTPLGTVKQRVRCGLGSMKKSLICSPRQSGEKQTTFPSLLADIVITEQLKYRPCRARDSRQEADSLRTLNELAADSTDHLIDFFIRLPIDLCRADSGGLSLLETNSNGEQIFRWTHISGTLAKYVGGHTPRNFSPCGVTLDAGSPQLFRKQARYFRYFSEVDVPIEEVLVIPFIVGNKTEGTIWIASHHEETEFDSEDARIMTSIAEFVGSAIHLNRSLPNLFAGQDSYLENA